MEALIVGAAHLPSAPEEAWRSTVDGKAGVCEVRRKCSALGHRVQAIVLMFITRAWRIRRALALPVGYRQRKTTASLGTGTRVLRPVVRSSAWSSTCRGCTSRSSSHRPVTSVVRSVAE